VSVLTVWRLCTAKYAATAYDGEGARLYGGRWSPKGVALTYTAESRALAIVEVLANTEEPKQLSLVPWVFIAAEFPPDLIEKPARVPEDWRQFPRSTTTQEFGATWAKEQRSVVLRVPSAVVPGEFNFLLNPRHPDFKRVKIGKPETFSFDPRLGN
jgi:RES domain-containing protein